MLTIDNEFSAGGNDFKKMKKKANRSTVRNRIRSARS